MLRVIASRCSTRWAHPNPDPDPDPNPNRHQVGIPTIAVMENMCGLSLPWAAPVADFAARHALSAAATAELESLFAASQAEALLFGESHVPKLQQMWGIEVRCA